MNLISFTNYYVVENCVLLGYYSASSGNFLPTFQDSLSVPFSRVNNPKKTASSSNTEFIQGRVGVVISSVMWCRSIQLMLVVWREGKCGSQCSIEETRSVREEIVTGVVERYKNIYMSRVEERKKKVEYMINT
jgi:hypothetical protein